MNLAVGDKVIIVTTRPSRRLDGIVTKIGRKWATAESVEQRWPHEYAFDKETGYGKPERSGFSAGFSVYTPEALEAKERRADLTSRLAAILRNSWWMRDLTDEQLAAVLAIVEPADQP